MSRGSLLNEVIRRDNLDAAWAHVRSQNDDECPSESIERFATSAQERLDRIEVELQAGTYEPLPLSRIEIPKKDGSVRNLSIPAVRDRIVERCVLGVVAPLTDRYLGPASYAYRAGIGVTDAVQAVARLRDEGLHWVLHTDVDDCFDTIPRDLAVRTLLAMLPDESLAPLIHALTRRPVSTSRGLLETRGVPQGTALSPLLANIVLANLDDALLDRGMPVVRYADDFVVLGRSRDSVVEAARIASAALEEIGMRLGEEKTEIMNFDDGFCFLGEDFGPRYPPATDAHRVAEPTRRVVYAGRQGSRLFTKSGRLVVQSKNDEELLSVPKSLVSRVVCFGAVSLAAGTRSWTLENGIDVVFLSRRGHYLGQQLAAVDGSRVTRLQRQLEVAADPAQALVIARGMVDSKIRHQITVLQRFARDEDVERVAAALHTMREMLLMVPDATASADLLGLEGAAAAAYFPTLGAMVPPELAFERRSRQPPLDVVNSALGYGYALLLSECVSALVVAGLDPNIGVLHKASGKRAGLALDLMEELRPMVVDQVVISCARRGSLLASHGAPLAHESGIHLTKAGKSALINAYERRMLQTTSGALPGFTGSLRRHLYRQAKRTMRSIMDPQSPWIGMSWR
ncbi:CRISPR-associated endonuclease Cas1 [Gordonia bronchialis]|uniref:CRISPR-associated endonuclease Cas1 n=1 Tax=Gordonia bronchialis TaxID=2054 RepID=UPI0022702A2B|nr:CRISPR-associated endonuclease Cas1 [Gordonia bronchialis]